MWPGTHLTHAEYFRAHGPEAFLAAGGYPPIRLPEPEQVTGEAGTCCSRTTCCDNIGGNTAPDSAPRRLFPISGPATTPGGASSCRTRGWTTTQSAADCG